MNNETLTLVNSTVPDVKPVILKDPKGLALNLHSGGIGFWVLPELQVITSICYTPLSTRVYLKRVNRFLFQIKSCMEPQQVLEPQNRRSNIRVTRDARGKVRGTRSLQDRGNARSERRKERDGSRVTKQPDARRELKRLRKFVKKELDDYDARRSWNIGETSNPKVENDSVRRVKSAGENSEPQDDTQTKLQEFKDRFTRIRDLIRTNGSKTAIGSSMNNTVTETVSLISKVQDALEAAKQETDYTSKVKASNSVKEHLKHLHDLLTRVSLTDSNDGSVSQEDKSERREKRAKRDLLGKIVNPSWDLNRGRLLRKRFRPEDVKGRRIHSRFRTREDVRVQPRVVDLGTSDSGENTFYGFFRTDPVEGFPEGNVFFAADDQPRSDSYDYTRGETARPTDYDDAEYDYDQRYYESVESMKNPSVPNPRVTPAELWEAETYERQGNSKSEEERDVEPDEQQESRDNQSYLRRLTGYYVPSASRNDRANSYDRSNVERGRSVVKPGRFRRTPAAAIKVDDQKTKISDHKVPTKEADFSMDGDVEDSKRAKRGSTDLYAVLDQEMINEDDANSRDCNCRVIRRSKPCIHRLKRGATTPVEHETNADVVPQQEIAEDSRGSDADASDSNFRDTDVEVFSELGASPLEILELQTEPSNLKIERNTEAPLQIELIEAHTESSSFRLDSSTTSSLNVGDDLDSSLKTNIRRDGSTFFRGETEKPAINNFEDTARYTSSSREDSTPVAEENDAETGEPAKEIQDSRAETSGTTLDPATLSKDIAKGPEYDHNNDTVARGSFKRQVEGESSTDTASTAERERKDVSTQLADNSKSKKSRPEYSSSRRVALSEKRARKMQMLRNAKTLLTLKRIIGKEKGRQAVESTTLGPSDKTRQFAQRGVPVTELVRAHNVRERVFHPKNRKNFRQSAIMKRSHPTDLMEEIVQLRDLYENVAERGERFDDDNGGTDKSYLALVEDLESPRIFRYQQQPQDGQKINLQVTNFIYTFL